jgi:hypothetical protein
VWRQRCKKNNFWHRNGTVLAQFLGKVCRGEERGSSTRTTARRSRREVISNQFGASNQGVRVTVTLHDRVLPHAVPEWEGYFKYFEYFWYCDCKICANTLEHLP